ncbi:tyrosine-type recombinase/integrase [Prevotella denticola]|uniref:tyrosine-type recombinase/integrase n=1 Tax=Prevotella denticola TaxID=28129 RepID=UPI00311A3563
MRQQTGRPFRKGVHGQCCHTEAGTGQGDRRQAADSEAGITENITSYMARHTWATLAHERNIPIAVISKAMGHTSERTTRIYIAELNSEIVHTANKEITDWRTGLPL